MRFLLMAAVAVLGMAGGCGLEDHSSHMKEEKEFTASRLDGKFGANDPIVQMLSPGEREALDRAGLMAEEDPETVTLDENGNPVPADGEESQSKMDKAGDVMMSLLTVGVTLGMMAAPYLLF